MANLFCTLFSSSLLFLVINHGLFSSSPASQVAAFIVNNGPAPKFSFLQEPPKLEIVSKKYPAVLPCSVNLTRLEDDLRHAFDELPSEDEEEYEDDDEDEEGDLEQQPDTRHWDDDEPNSPLRATVFKNRPTISHFNTNERKQLTHFNALKPDDDLTSPSFRALSRLGESKSGFRRKRRRRHSTGSPLFHYTWLRNDEILDVEASDSFELVGSGGSLKISFSNQAQGRYRCIINETRRNFGAIISREASVIVTEFTRSNFSTNITAEIGVPLVLNCPILSYPPANITWFFNETSISPSKAIVFENQNRYFQLQNGSLLIKRVTGFEDGKFKCVARNNFLQKSQRVFKPQVNVVPQQYEEESKQRTGRLLPPLQDQIQRIVEGSTLRLLCASFLPEHPDGDQSEISWTFVARSGNNAPIEILNASNELKFNNITGDHDGFYNCSTNFDYQTFDVTILIPPTFTQIPSSINTRIATSISLPCSATGYPKPNITWYRNGIPLRFSPPIYYEEGVLRLHSVDPEDTGIYQCFARNEADEVNVSGYITLRTQNKPRRLHQVRCFPINYMTLLVTFKSADQFDMANYYVATSNPYTWKPVPVHLKANNSFKIADHLVPLKEYTVYVRGLKNTAVGRDEGKPETYELSRMSKGIRCSTQGLEILSTAFPNKIFLWWPQFSSGAGYGIKLDYFIIQFWNNDSSNSANFSDQVIGTTGPLDEYNTWKDIEMLLTKIPTKTTVKTAASLNTGRAKYPTFIDSDEIQAFDATSFSKGSITELRIPGNVTGVLIPNANRVVARVLGFRSDENVDSQNLRFVQWKVIQNSPNGVSRLRVISANSKNVELAWNAFDKGTSQKCLKLCYKQINADVLIRGGTPECKEINANKSSITLKPLPPLTIYKMYLRSCNSSEPITEMIDVQTRPDVPGKVNHPQLVAKSGGVVFNWEPPLPQNGVRIQHYSIEWNQNNGVSGIANISASDTSFRIPNMSSSERFNISIRAVGNTGLGVPHFFNLTKTMDYYGDTNRLLNSNNVVNPNADEDDDLLLAVLLGTLVCTISILMCSLIIFVHRKRAKRRNRDLQSYNHVNSLQNDSSAIDKDNNITLSVINNCQTTAESNIGRSNNFGNLPIMNNYQERMASMVPLTLSTPREELNGEDDTDYTGHEMQTLVSSVQIVPNMTMTTTLSNETLPPLSSAQSEQESIEESNPGDDSTEAFITSTPRKNGVGSEAAGEHFQNGGDGSSISDNSLQLPHVDLVFYANPPSCNKNNNINSIPIVSKPQNHNNLNTALVTTGQHQPQPMQALKTFQSLRKKIINHNNNEEYGLVEANRRSNLSLSERENLLAVCGSPPKLGNDIRMRYDEDEDEEEEEDDNSQMHLLNSRNHSSGFPSDRDLEADKMLSDSRKNGGTTPSLTSPPLWTNFRQPIVGPNG